MSEKKKQVRKKFREVVFERDGHKCVICGEVKDLAAHHITNRNKMPDSGYVPENGITLCNIQCHEIAEDFHKTGSTIPGFMPDDLYKLIGSSKEEAIKASRIRCLEELARLTEEMGLYNEGFYDE